MNDVTDLRELTLLAISNVINLPSHFEIEINANLRRMKRILVEGISDRIRFNEFTELAYSVTHWPTQYEDDQDDLHSAILALAKPLWAYIVEVSHNPELIDK